MFIPGPLSQAVPLGSFLRTSTFYMDFFFKTGSSHWGGCYSLLVRIACPLAGVGLWD